MADQVKLQYAGSNSLLVVSPSGKLRRLFVPIMVKCIRGVNIIRQGSTVYVEEIAEHPKCKLMYRVLGSWYSFEYFRI
jgi:hypothetical protein